MRVCYNRGIQPEIPADIGKGIIKLSGQRQRTLNPPTKLKIVKPITKIVISKEPESEYLPNRQKSRDSRVKKKKTVDRMMPIVNENPDEEILPNQTSSNSHLRQNSLSREKSKYEL